MEALIPSRNVHRYWCYGCYWGSMHVAMIMSLTGKTWACKYVMIYTYCPGLMWCELNRPPPTHASLYSVFSNKQSQFNPVIFFPSWLHFWLPHKFFSKIPPRPFPKDLNKQTNKQTHKQTNKQKTPQAMYSLSSVPCIKDFLIVLSAPWGSDHWQATIKGSSTGEA